MLPVEVERLIYLLLFVIFGKIYQNKCICDVINEIHKLIWRNVYSRLKTSKVLILPYPYNINFIICQRLLALLKTTFSKEGIEQAFQ